MSCICCMRNLLFLRKTTLAVLEVEYMDRGHYSVALASTFFGHCIQRKKKKADKLFLWKTEMFLFAWRLEQSLQHKTQQCCIGRSCMWWNERMHSLFFSLVKNYLSQPFYPLALCPLFLSSSSMFFLSIFSEHFIGLLGGDYSSQLASWELPVVSARGTEGQRAATQEGRSSRS